MFRLSRAKSEAQDRNTDLALEVGTEIIFATRITFQLPEKEIVKQIYNKYWLMID